MRRPKGLSQAEKDKRRPRPPEELVGALQDRVASTSGKLLSAAQLCRKHGFDEPTEEQRRKNLALNIALLDWPRR